MANQIHPGAMVGKDVQLGDGNEIGPGCVIADGAVLGSANTLWMNVYVGPGTTIGNGNEFHMGAVVGHVPQDHGFTGAQSFTRIGHQNIIREYVTIHRGTKEGSATVLGDHNMLMANSHVAHNCELGNHVTLVNVASLTGYCIVEDGAFISGIVGLHQFTRVGRLAIISALSAVNKDVPPYTMCGGRPAVVQGLNVIGLRRAGISPDARMAIKRAFKHVYREGLSVAHAIEAIEREPMTPEVEHFVKFIKASERGILAGVLDADADEGESLLPRKTLRASRE